MSSMLAIFTGTPSVDACTARTQYNSLNSTDRAVLANKGDTSVVDTPAGAAGVALDFALAQRGKAYVFGSNGPDTWDCSSLTQASYRAAGVNIPRGTYTQATTGRAVSRAEVLPGDLIIYYSGQSHVAMAVDNVRAVHASTEGVPVKIANIDDIGPISVIRRIVGRRPATTPSAWPRRASGSAAPGRGSRARGPAPGRGTASGCPWRPRAAGSGGTGGSG